MITLFRLIGLRHLRMKPLRSVLTALGVCFGVALYTAISVINHSTLETFRRNVAALSGKAQLTITAGEAGFPESRLQTIEETPGVLRAVAMVQARTRMSGATALNVLGIDLLDAEGSRVYGTSIGSVIPDPLVFMNHADSIAVASGFALRHGLKLGSEIRLDTARGSAKFVVRGLLGASGLSKAFGGDVAVMDIAVAQAAFGKEGKLDRADLLLRESENPEAVAQRMHERLGAGYLVEPPEGQTLNLSRVVSSFQAMMSFFSFYALLVGLFLVANSVSISVAERRKEFGTLRALGSSRTRILALVVSEAAAIGALGALAGALIGRVLASLLLGVVTRSLSNQAQSAIEVSRLWFGASDVVRAVAVGSAVSIGAALWPALRATAIAPLEAMRQPAAVARRGGPSAFRGALAFGIALMGYYALSSRLSWGTRLPVLSVLDQVAAVLGPALAGPAIVLQLLRASSSFVARNAGIGTRLAHDALLRNGRRTATNVMCLMVGFVLVILIDGVNLSFTSTVTDWFDKVCRGDLVVSSGGQLASMDVQPVDEKAGLALSRVPGVDLGSDPGMSGGVHPLRFIHLPFEGHSLLLKAIYEMDPRGSELPPFDVIDQPWQAAQAELFHGKDPSIFVSENFVLHFHKRVGDWVPLATPGGEVRFRIAGMVRDYSSFEGVVYLPRDRYRDLWKDTLVNAFVVYLRPGADPQLASREIDRLLDGEGLKAMSLAHLKKEMQNTIDQSFGYLKAVEFSALLVGLLGLLNTLLVSVLERSRELGMLRAVGMSKRALIQMILRESMLQGVLGALVAVALGGWVGRLWVTYTLTHLLGWVVHFDFPWLSLATTVLLGGAVAWLAGFLPSRRAAKLEIAAQLS